MGNAVHIVIKSPFGIICYGLTQIIIPKILISMIENSQIDIFLRLVIYQML